MTGIILDTNVISEPKRPTPSSKVVDWFAAQNPQDLFITAMVVAELSMGIERMAPGQRKRDMQDWRDRLIDQGFSGRILLMDTEAALIYGQIVAAAFAQGRPPGVADAQIAAVAKANNMAVATRDISDFEAFDIEVIDPWSG